MIEVVAGLLDDRSPQEAIRREAEEEAGCSIEAATHLFDAYMSPGAVTERLSFFVAAYDSAKRGPGGGLAGEGEDIEILELPLDAALAMIVAGEIVDAKTIMLLQWAGLHGLPGPGG
jgi:nudix-type nucleoside diphosphatase (YffH/AdpP family)